uniref:Uncharacterized protein n=1 Tax=Ignisphaera aggregans TaxID=334771 RepID=A0A7C2V8V4_9CREN
MIANLYLGYTHCDDALKYVGIEHVDALGLDASIIYLCAETLQSSVSRNIVVVPRKIARVTDEDFNQCLASSRTMLSGCEPLSINSARRLAKVRRVLSIVLTPRSRRFVDESQVNFMVQSPKPKYIEVHLHPFIERLVNERLDIDSEKEFYFLGNVIETALKRDVGVVPVSASPRLSETLLMTHIDIILYAMGFSKRERRLMIELYPVDFIGNWLSQQV